MSQLTGRRNVGNVEDSFDRVAFSAASQQHSFDREQPLVKRRVFQPLFLDRADINEVYRNIDSQKFTIIPAVPSIHLQRSEKSLVNSRTQDILFPSPQLKPIRNPKEQSIAQSKAPLETFQEQPKNFHRPTIQPSRPKNIVSEAPVIPVNNLVTKQSSEERKKFRRCHGRCVQKFCLPAGDTRKHRQCQETCRDICNV